MRQPSGFTDVCEELLANDREDSEVFGHVIDEEAHADGLQSLSYMLIEGMARAT